VPNDQLSLAIGRQGQNVCLASKLLGWRIDVKSEQRYANLEDPGYQSLLTLKGVEEPLADQFCAKNIKSITDMAHAKVEDLTILRAIDDAFALSLIEEARKKLGDAYIPAAVPAEETGDATLETTPEADQEKPSEAGVDSGEPEESGTEGE
jgi:N utilization substance protein A